MKQKPKTRVGRNKAPRLVFQALKDYPHLSSKQQAEKAGVGYSTLLKYKAELKKMVDAESEKCQAHEPCDKWAFMFYGILLGSFCTFLSITLWSTPA